MKTIQYLIQTNDVPRLTSVFRASLNWCVSSTSPRDFIFIAKKRIDSEVMLYAIVTEEFMQQRSM